MKNKMKKIVKESLIPLLESPDHINLNDITYSIGGSETYAFEVIVNTDNNEILDVIIAKKPKSFHGEDEYTSGFMSGYPGSKVNFDNTLKPYEEYWEKIYPGRLFLDPKVITFWVYPTDKELKTIIEIIEKKKKIKIIDNNWKIEIYKEGLENRGKQEYQNNYERDNTDEVEYIPIEKFVGSKKPPEREKLQHLETKTKHKVPYGYGSKNPKYLKKRQWQMATLGDESIKEKPYPSLFEEDIMELNKKLIKTIKDSGGNEVKVFLVNGTYVKNPKLGLGFEEFVEGGHHYVDSYPGYKKHIPENEIWIDDAFKNKLEDVKGILLHEYLERNLMKYKKWSYSKAHEYANKKEKEFRKRD